MVVFKYIFFFYHRPTTQCKLGAIYSKRTGDPPTQAAIQNFIGALFFVATNQVRKTQGMDGLDRRDAMLALPFVLLC